MVSKVKVTANEAGDVIVMSKENNKYGHIRVEQKRTVISDKGWVKVKPVSALLHGTVEDLEQFGFEDGQLIQGKIVIKESLVPFNAENPEKDYKIAGTTGIVCCVDGQPIYRKTFYNPSANDQDETIVHDNSEAIRLANAESEVPGSVDTEQGFTL
jgi:hypothetical protein